MMYLHRSGGKWVPCAELAALEANDDVRTAVIKPEKAPECRRLRLYFNACAPGKILTLTELEIWGEVEER